MMMFWYYLLQAKIELTPQTAGIITALIAAIATTITTYFNKRSTQKVNEGTGEKAMAEARAIDRSSEIKASIELSDASLRFTAELGERLTDVMKALTETEARADRLQEELYAVKDRLHEERHRANNVQHKLNIFIEEVEEERKRYRLNLDMMNQENDRLREENKLLKTKSTNNETTT